MYGQCPSGDPRVREVDSILRRKHGATTGLIQIRLGTTAKEARALLRAVLDLGGEVKAVKCNITGDFRFRLFGYSQRKRRSQV
jgi:hypothetical protein